MTGVAQHEPVLLDEVLDALKPAGDRVYVDGTFGRGGYSRAILKAASDCRVIAIDQDPDAVSAGRELEAQVPGRFTIFESRFSDLDRVVKSAGVDLVAGVALDIGVSSVQLDEDMRGFSFAKEAPLDMRMSREGLTAAQVVNETSESELSDIIYQYGEERAARRVAKAIARRRESGPIETTTALAAIVESVVGRSRSGKQKHPATRTFQALRIYVNDEIHELAFGLSAAERILVEGGCLAVVTFHSLEDRLVKKFFGSRAGGLRSVSRYQPPLQDGPEPSFRLPKRRPTTPRVEEVERNPRARSAKLRAACRTSASPHNLDLSELGLDKLPRRSAA